MSPEAHKKKLAYMREWYAKNRESEIAKAIQRKKKLLASLNETTAELYRKKRSAYYKVEKLNRDLRRSIDPVFDKAWREKRRISNAVQLERTKTDPLKKEAYRQRHRARVADYRRRKKTGDLRKSQEIFRLGGKPIKETKPAKDRMPTTPKSLKKLKLLTAAMALGNHTP